MTARPLPLTPARQGLRVIPGGAARVPRVGWWAAFTSTVLAAFFGLILSRTALDHSAFVLDELQREISLEEARYEELRLEVARLRSPERILDLGREMGLVFPEEVRTVEAPGVVPEAPLPDQRWAEVKSILGAQP